MKTRLLLLIAALAMSFGSLSAVNVQLKAGAGGEITGNESPALSANETYLVTPDEDYRVHTVFVNDAVWKTIDKSGTSVNITVAGDIVITATFILESDVDVWNGSDVSTGLSGDGTAASPYLIESCADWAYLSEQPTLYQGRNEFLLTKHLDFGNFDTPQVGYKTTNATTTNYFPFIGFFNGNNKTFINVYLNPGSNNDISCAMFGTMTGNAANKYNSVICNLGIVSGKNIASKNTNIAAIVGSIEASVSTDFLDGKSYSFTGSIFNCYNYIDVTRNAANSGGIVGSNGTGKGNYLYGDLMLANCYNRGSASNGIGGETGSNYPYYSVYNSGTIHAGNNNNQAVYCYQPEGWGVLNAYYDSQYASGTSTAYAVSKTTAEMCTQNMADLLNAGRGAPFYNQKAWAVDTEGIINAGKPYLNNAYRVYSSTSSVSFAPAAGYHPFLAYEGDVYKFRIIAADPSQRFASGTVKVNGTDATLDADGYYTVSNINGKLEISCGDAVFDATGVSIWDGKSSQAITAGDGSLENPYQISSAAQFIWVAMNMTDLNSTPKTSDSFILTADIDFNGFHHPFIADSEGFTGTFDGNGHKIYNLRVIRNRYCILDDSRTGASNNLGLIGTAKEGAVVKNVIIESGRIEGNSSLGFVGYCTGSVSLQNNAIKNLTIFTYSQNVGLLVGSVNSNTCTFKNNYAIGRFLRPLTSSLNNVGAMIGWFEQNCKATLNSNYVVFYDMLDKLYSGANDKTGLADGSANNFFNGTGSYGKTLEDLQSQATVDLLNTGQRKVWTVDADANGGFPAFNKIYQVTLPTIDNGVFEPAAGYDADIVYGSDTYIFRINMAASFTAKDVTVYVNGSEVAPDEDNQYIVENVNSDLVVTYTGEIAIKTFSITLTFNAEGGTASTNPENIVNYGDNVVCTITPNEGYAATVTVNGNLTSFDGDPIEITDVVDDVAIDVVFEKQKIDILVLAGPGGTVVEAEGSVNPVSYGESCTFDILPETGYQIKQVYVDEEPIGAVTSYTFMNVKTAHKIEAAFEQVTAIKNTDANPVALVYKSGTLFIEGDSAIDKVTVYSALGYQIAQQQGISPVSLGDDHPVIIVVIETDGAQAVYKVVRQ